MTQHPDTYVMSRAEWLEVNRVLASCSLALRWPNSSHEKAKRREKHQAVRGAQTIMSEVYERAALRAVLGDALRAAEGE